MAVRCRERVSEAERSAVRRRHPRRAAAVPSPSAGFRSSAYAAGRTLARVGAAARSGARAHGRGWRRARRRRVPSARSSSPGRVSGGSLVHADLADGALRPTQPMQPTQPEQFDAADAADAARAADVAEPADDPGGADDRRR